MTTRAKPHGIDCVLAALQEYGCKPKPQGEQWRAFCPVPSHPDKNPSLYILEAPDKKVLFHCFGGCTYEQVCRALHIELSDTFDRLGNVPLWASIRGFTVSACERVGAKEGKRGQVTIPMYDMDYKIVGYRLRMADNSNFPGTDCKAKTNGGGHQGIMHEVPFPDADQLDIAEGETDLLSGLSRSNVFHGAALALPGASLTGIVRDAVVARSRRRTVRLWPHNDQAGEQLTREAKALLKDVGCRVHVALIGAQYKDLDDMLQATRDDYRFEGARRYNPKAKLALTYPPGIAWSDAFQQLSRGGRIVFDASAQNCYLGEPVRPTIVKASDLSMSHKHFQVCRREAREAGFIEEKRTNHGYILRPTRDVWE